MPERRRTLPRGRSARRALKPGVAAFAVAAAAAGLARARKLLGRGEPVERVLEALAQGLTHKMLHGTLAELHATEGAEREKLADTVSRLFLRQGQRRPGGEGR